ncbi:unnamed protein product, partial [Meganyctiphanes norvegica]
MYHGNSTCWCDDIIGDVEIPEICIYSIDNKCRFEETGCKRLHSTYTYYWQIKHYGPWINFRSVQSRELEEFFKDPANNECSITPFDIRNIEPGVKYHHPLLLWKVSLTSMTIQDDSNIHTYKIRRLSTASAAESNSTKATVYDWYFLNQYNIWTKYEDEYNVTSNYIESNFLFSGKSLLKYKIANFEYELDFSKMIQRNISTGKEREVRRRPHRKLKRTKRNISSVKEKEGCVYPHKNVETASDELQLNIMETDSIPGDWHPMLKTDSMVRVSLTPEQTEYVEEEKLLTAEVDNVSVISIHRIQNPFLWRALQNKKKQLLTKYGSENKLNMQKLFHGTKSENIDQICEQNFDWRLHGTKTGQLYGRGTYFSNSTAYSHSYCDTDSNGHRFMMVAKVLVGYTTKGDASMTRPPLNPSTGMLYDTTVDNVSKPKIFVKYDNQEYYPEYVIEYTNNVPN